MTATVSYEYPAWFECEAQDLAENHWQAVVSFARVEAERAGEFQYWAICSRALEIQDSWRRNSWIG